MDANVLTPDQQQRLVNALHDAVIVLDGCAKRADTPQTAQRLYDRAQLYRDLLAKVGEPVPNPSMAFDVLL